MLGVNVRICTPKSLNPKEAYVDIAKEKRVNMVVQS